MISPITPPRSIHHGWRTARSKPATLPRARTRTTTAIPAVRAVEKASASSTPMRSPSRDISATCTDATNQPVTAVEVAVVPGGLPVPRRCRGDDVLPLRPCSRLALEAVEPPGHLLGARGQRDPAAWRRAGGIEALERRDERGEVARRLDL